MRLHWQCPTCFAELGNREHAKVLTCPFCGSLLVVGPEKFYLAKNEDGWYYFSRKYLHGNSGYLKFGENEEYYLFSGERWYLVKGEVKYELQGEMDECEGEIVERGEVNHIWGELPILLLPGMRVETLKCEGGICKKTTRGCYSFRKV